MRAPLGKLLSPCLMPCVSMLWLRRWEESGRFGAFDFCEKKVPETQNVGQASLK